MTEQPSALEQLDWNAVVQTFQRRWPLQYEAAVREVREAQLVNELQALTDALTAAQADTAPEPEEGDDGHTEDDTAPVAGNGDLSELPVVT